MNVKKGWMRRIILMTAVLLAVPSMGVRASGIPEHPGEGSSAGEAWQVTFNGKKLESNFDDKAVADLADDLQPGDTVTLELSLKNSDKRAADWYLSNEILKSFEDPAEGEAGRAAAPRNGAYTYILTYQDADAGETTELYNSNRVGGEKLGDGDAPLGLNEVEESLKDYVYLGRLKTGKEGTLRLEVTLDGETQGNDYARTLASLKLNFAVESVSETGNPGGGGGSENRTVHRTVTQYVITGIQTGDASQTLLWTMAALCSGLLLLVLFIGKLRKEKGGKFRFLSGLLSLGLVLSGSVGFQAEASGNTQEDYTYQAVFHAGGQGTFQGTEQVKVTPGGSGQRTENVDIALSQDRKTITVTGLYAGDHIAFDVSARESAADGNGDGENTAIDESTLAVRLNNGSRYYVKGLQKSGRDGSDPLDSALPSGGVDGDLDYVVSYGIQGDMTAYQVHYQDASGRTLAPSQTYSGNVGDRPVAAYIYIPGYQPQAYNLTRTLVKNAAENEFTFIYTPIPTGGTTAGGGGGGGVTVEETVETVTLPGGVAQAPGGGGAGPGGAAPAGPGGGEEIPDEDVPLAPPEILDLDDEEVPLASGDRGGSEDSSMKTGKKTFYGLTAVAAAGAGALAAVCVWLWKRKKKQQGAKVAAETKGTKKTS